MLNFMKKNFPFHFKEINKQTLHQFFLPNESNALIQEENYFL